MATTPGSSMGRPPWAARPVRPDRGRPPQVLLTRNLVRSIQSGHPWLYREALQAPPGLQAGTVVDLVDRAGRFLGRGLYDAESPIALRLFTLDRGEAVDAALVHRRLAEALALRRRTVEGLGEQTNAFRLCHGEGDRLPGLVIDVYDHIAVLICDGAAAQSLVPAATAAVLELLADLGVRAVYERQQRRSGGGGRLLHGELAPRQAGSTDDSLRPGDPLRPGEVLVREHGMRLLVDVVSGQKTGLFIDQRENRRRIRGCAAGLTVWNGFSYTGGFSVAAALGGARRVVTVDRAAPAVETARRSFGHNQLDPAAHGFVVADVFEELSAMHRRGERFDLVIVDPPSFAKAEKDVPAALSAYRELHRLALDAVQPGGLLAAASCSSHVDENAFLGTLTEAATAAGRPLRFLEIHGQPADHPTLPAFPEGRYLKFVLCAAG
ncbi:MAG: class I SAM-dependent rRNA methyltransferase [Polyangia bacterium]